MPPFDFPNAPTVGQTVPGPNNTQYRWDGAKWVTVIPTGGGGGGSITISDTAPTNPSTGNLWFDSVGLQTYIWYTDPTSSQWTPVINQGGLLSDAPSDGTLYGRENGAWSPAGTVTSVGLQMPALFNVANSPITGSGTLAVNIPNQGQNTVWAGPSSGGSGQPVFRALTAADVPTLAYLPLTGGTLTGNLTLSYALPIIYLNKTTPTNSNFIAGQTNGVNRWSILLGDATAESGSNAGSNFQLVASADGGSSLGAALLINRANALATFTGAGIVVNTSNGGLGLNGATASQRAIDFYTNGSDRWRIMANQTAEGGSNTGSDFNIACFADNGAFLSTPLAISRSNGNATFSSSITTGDNISINRSAGWPTLVINKPASGTGCQQLGLTNGVNRWALLLGDNSGETGGNVGSDFRIQAFNDSGTYLSAPFVITRASGNAVFNNPLSVGRPASGIFSSAGYAIVGFYQGGNYYNAEAIGITVAGTQGVIGYNNGSNNFFFSGSGSDRRIKSNIRDVELDAIAMVKRIPIYACDYNPPQPSMEVAAEMGQQPPETWPFSFIADEVGAVMPHATIKHREDDGILYHVALHPQHMIATLWRAVQQLTAEVETLKAQVGAQSV